MIHGPSIKRQSRSQPQNLRAAKIHVIDLARVDAALIQKKYFRLKAHKKAEQLKHFLDNSRRQSLCQTTELLQKKESQNHKIKTHQYSLDSLQSRRHINLEPLFPEVIPKEFALKKMKQDLIKMFQRGPKSKPLELVSEKIQLSFNSLQKQRKLHFQGNELGKQYSNLFLNISKKWLVKNKKLARTIQINRRFDPVSPWPVGNGFREDESEFCLP